MMRFAILFMCCCSFFQVSLCAQEIIFSDDFETGTFKTEWQVHPGETDGIIEIFSDETAPHSGVFGVRIGKSRDGGGTTNALDLHLNLAGREQVELSFWIRRFHDDTQVEDGIWFSDNGGETFKKVYDFDFSRWSNNVYGQPPPLDVDDLASKAGLTLTNQFVIRFQQHGSGDFNTSNDEDGMFLDDIFVQVPATTYMIPPYIDSFEGDVLGTAWHWGDPGRSTPPGVSSPFGRIDIVQDTNAPDGLNVLAIGRRVDGRSITNALDLHLNLAGLTQVEMNFWIRRFYDDTQVEDGIWFSDNGGETFKKVYNFDFSSWSNNVYGQPPPLDVDRLATDNGLQLTDQFIVRFQQHGSGDFNTSDDEDGMFLDLVSVTVPEVLYATLPFQDGFESEKLQNMWYWGDPGRSTPPGASSPFGRVDIVRDANAPEGLNVVAMGRRVDGRGIANALDLHLNLSGYEQVEMNFWIRRFYDDTQVEDGIWFSDNGGETFKKVYDFDFSSWSNNVYGQLPPLDIDRLASNNNLELTDRFVIRFQQYGSGDFNTSDDEDGMFLDLVEVRVPVIEYATLPFKEGFEVGSFRSFWHWGDPELTTPKGRPTPYGLVHVISGSSAPHDGLFGVQMGRRVDGGGMTNSLDLHVNLLGHEQVEMNFWIRRFHDETQVEDGIWFSDNGGETFKKVYNFDLSSWSNDVYGQPPPLDVDRLAADKGLSLTDRFVVRFQQHGSGDFNTSDDEDGIYLDDVEIYALQTEYVQPPFQDSFEDQILGRAWHWGDPSKSTPAGRFSPFGLVQIVPDENAPDGLNMLRLGRRIDGNAVTNALDLRVDLLGMTNVQLSFWLRRFSDELQVQDGVWLSEDGGETFVKIADLAGGNSFERKTLGIDVLAKDNGLDLTNQMVIRFQQHGSGDFNTSGDEDGIFLDDIQIQGSSGHTQFSRGDVNGNGDVDVGDAISILRFAANLETPSANQLAAADLDRDGAITSADAIIILRLVTGLIDVLPKQSVPDDIKDIGIATALHKDSNGRFVLRATVASQGWSGGDIILDYGLPIQAQDVLVKGVPENTMRSINTTQEGKVLLSFASMDASDEAQSVEIEIVLSDIVDRENLDLMIEGQLYNSFGVQIGNLDYQGQVLTPPSKVSLGQNFPNPFNPETAIRYDLPESSEVVLRIYNINGQIVRTLVNEHKTTGRYVVVWDGRDDYGQAVSSGLYIYHLFVEQSGYVATKRMVLLK